MAERCNTLSSYWNGQLTWWRGVDSPSSHEMNYWHGEEVQTPPCHTKITSKWFQWDEGDRTVLLISSIMSAKSLVALATSNTFSTLQRVLHFVIFIPICCLTLTCLTCFFLIYVINILNDTIMSFLWHNIASFLCLSIVLLSLYYGTILTTYATILTFYAS